jgi:hypothetical protein
MQQLAYRNGFDGTADTRLLRRIIFAAGLVLAVLILVAVAVYAAAFIMLAPMMA